MTPSTYFSRKYHHTESSHQKKACCKYRRTSISKRFNFWTHPRVTLHMSTHPSLHFNGLSNGANC